MKSELRVTCILENFYLLFQCEISKERTNQSSRWKRKHAVVSTYYNIIALTAEFVLSKNCRIRRVVLIVKETAIE